LDIAESDALLEKVDEVSRMLEAYASTIARSRV
jgi:hypothetical protein